MPSRIRSTHNVDSIAEVPATVKPLSLGIIMRIAVHYGPHVTGLRIEGWLALMFFPSKTTCFHKPHGSDCRATVDEAAHGKRTQDSLCP